MYNFIDINEVSEGDILPSEALKINGEYIENQIGGYRTLHVSGREALSPDVETYTTGIRDGSRLKKKKYPERIITVTYQLTAESNEAFREAYNKLGGILNVEEAELIFNDEQDKFFIGTPCIIGNVKPGMNSVVGEFEILCADPFKYSVIEYEAECNLDESSILVDYNGTYKAYPTLEAKFYSENEVAEDGETVTALTGAGDCGFVAFFNEDEKIIQIGDPEEADTEEAYAKSQCLMSQTYRASTAWGTAAQALWTANDAITNPLEGTTVPIQTGSVGMKTITYAVEGSESQSWSGRLLRATSAASSPTFNYSVYGTASKRTANSVKVDISITASLGSSSSYFGKGYQLNAAVYIGGEWHEVVMKDTITRWEGCTGHTKNISVTVTGLAAGTETLTGIRFRATRPDSTGGTAGELASTACNALYIGKYVASQAETYYLTATNFGTAQSHGAYGAGLKRTLPADAAGEVGAVNFDLTYMQWMSIGNGTYATKEGGTFEVMLTDANGANVAGVQLIKSSTGNNGFLWLYVNGKARYTKEIDLSYAGGAVGNKYNKGATSCITKSGNKVSFRIGIGASKNVNVSYLSDAIADTAVTDVSIYFGQIAGCLPLSYNGLETIRFTKDNCETRKDIPNKFGANDIVTADCSNGEIYLNGILSPELGALGNDWETFTLTPGLNQIGVAYSSWLTADYAPKMKLRYREVFL